MPLEIWTEKYRPQKLDEVINQRHVVEKLKVWAQAGSVPNMMFAGSAGVGKTTIALCMAKEIFGLQWRDNFLELNASDERGIDVVRGKIKDFARTRPIGSEFKLLLLDESDALTPEAQQALRRTMERYSSICRFILSCNYSSRIIEPIQSRCVVFRFRGLSGTDMEIYANRIIKAEGLSLDKDAMGALVELAEGDLRKVANLLQACATSKNITKELLYEISAQVKPDEVKAMLGLVLAGSFDEARKQLFNLVINQGVSAEDIIRTIHRELFNLPIEEKAKVELLEKIGEYEFRLNQGGTPEIQLLALLAQFLKYKK